MRGNDLEIKQFVVPCLRHSQRSRAKAATKCTKKPVVLPVKTICLFVVLIAVEVVVAVAHYTVIFREL